MDELNNQKSSMVEIFVNLLSFMLLGIVATSTGIVFYQVINKYFPDILSDVYRSFQLSGYSTSLIRYAIASLFVGFPLYILAVWFWFRSFKDKMGKVESKISKWLTYIILFIAAGTIIGDLIVVVFNFLQGEFGARFLLKALVILVIATVIFSFYFFERKKIQYKNEVTPNLFLAFGILSAVLVVSAIILGFIAGGSPAVARQRNLDFQRVQSLQQLSSCIDSFSYDNERLPKDLNEIKNNARYGYCLMATSDPETAKEYEYKVVSQDQFELCGNFSLSTLDEFQNNTYIGKWDKHSAGRICETQTVTFNKTGIVPAPMMK